MKKIIIILFLLITYNITAQNNIDISENEIIDNKSSTELVDFLGIKYREIKFTGKDLIGKSLSIKRYEYNGKSIIKSDIVFPNANVIDKDYGKLNDSIFSFRVFIQLNDKRTLVKTKTTFLKTSIIQNIPIYSNSDIVFMDEEKKQMTELLEHEDKYYCIIEYNTDLPEFIEIYYRKGNLKSELTNDEDNDRQLLIYEISID
ncbi:hypothetical protein [Psychroserpens ponticola]|uniref:Uncharacterized protein n=1 Tax=Psychroserpens ponticola TaxID=2932268 RepID=A0ABY7S2U4_9FLAO|nr:hypothetical protein [Psychroserpens ponticola]WCO03607.1 hypothetical protein MUN68_008870 [Psychroserpens ponticola]